MGLEILPPRVIIGVACRRR